MVLFGFLFEVARENLTCCAILEMQREALGGKTTFGPALFYMLSQQSSRTVQRDESIKMNSFGVVHFISRHDAFLILVRHGLKENRQTQG